MAIVEYEGLRELAQAFQEIDRRLQGQVKVSMEAATNLVTVETQSRFRQWGYDHGRQKSAAHSAYHIESRVRLSGKTGALAVVAQTLRKSRDLSARRPNWGGLQVRKAMLPARAVMLPAVVAHLENGVGKLLARHGFM